MSFTNKKTVLIAEDNVAFVLMITSLLQNDYNLKIFENGANALEWGMKNQFDLAILDVMLPGKDGYEICTSFKNEVRTKDIPIIFLTARTSEEEKVHGFTLGADDYITKPFSPLEFKARVQAKLRSSSQTSIAQRELKFGDLIMQPESQRVFYTQEQQRIEIKLTSLEFKILMYFTTNVDRVLSRGKILDAVWSDMAHVNERTVDTHVSKLRRKLGPYMHYIESVHGEGYRFLPQASNAKSA